MIIINRLKIWFTRARIAMLVIFSVFCMILHRGGIMLGNHYHLWDEKRVPCVWRNDPLTPKKGPVPHITIDLPSCLLRWRNESINEVRDATKVYYDEWMKSGQYESVCKSGGALGFGAKREPFHQPHFAGQYFFYLSLMLWQDVIFQGKMCLRHFLVEEQSVEFWTGVLEDKQTWPIQVMHYMDNAIAVNHLGATSCALEKHKVPQIAIPKKHDWFFHGSDAYWLGSTLMREKDPCQSVVGSSAALASRVHLQFTMLQRAWARKILNPDEVISTLKSLNSNTVNFNTSIVNFEDAKIDHQVRVIRDSDFVLSVHGAGMTNIAFLKPCSVAIEIMPFALGIPPNIHYFGALARSTGALHYTWVAQKDHSPLIPDAFLDGGYDCRPLYNPLPNDVFKAMQTCYDNKYCRACCKLTTIHVDAPTLQDVVKKALVDRQTCIRSHPLYK